MTSIAFEHLFDEVLAHYQEDLQRVRTGRASTEFVSSVMVEAYGTHSPLPQLASIAAPDASTVVIQPWDRSILKDIEKAILGSDLRLTPSNDGQVLRLNFPPLTEERRKELTKVITQKSEDARIRIKQERETVLKRLKQQEKDKEISEDERSEQEKKLQAAVNEAHQEIAKRSDKKKDELMTL